MLSLFGPGGRQLFWLYVGSWNTCLEPQAFCVGDQDLCSNVCHQVPESPADSASVHVEAGSAGVGNYTAVLYSGNLGEVIADT